MANLSDELKTQKESIVGDRTVYPPLLTALSDLAMRITGIRFIVVIPHGDRWEQIVPGAPASRSGFCRLIQGSADGAKQCRMCHILMSIAACSSRVSEQRCHAGLSVLVTPILAGESNLGLAVLSSCMFLAGVKQRTWKETEERGRQLGLDIGELRRAFDSLPELTGEKLELARSIMQVAGEAVMEINARLRMEEQIKDSQRAGKAQSGVRGVMEQELRAAMLLSASAPAAGARKSGTMGQQVPAVIRIVADLVRQKPHMPFTVTDIAAAARMTPNYFSTLFHKHMGKSFSALLTDARIEVAKGLLHDLRLNVGEVALKAGFDDAGYFARRFRQRTGRTPREWRHSLGEATPRA